MQNFSIFISSFRWVCWCPLPNIFCVISTLQSKFCYQTNLWIEEDKSILFLEVSWWHSRLMLLLKLWQDVPPYHCGSQKPWACNPIGEKVGKGGNIGKKTKTTWFYCNRIKLHYYISKVKVVGEFLVFFIFTCILLC